MTAKDKQWALNQLRHRKNTFVLTLCAIHLLKSDSLYTLNGKRFLLKDESIVFDPFDDERVGKRIEIELDQVIQSRDNSPDDFQYDLGELIKSSRRNLLKESFEAVKAYTESNSSFSKIKVTDEQWFQYTRLIRNAISHDFHWTFSRRDIHILPISYGSLTIDTSMQGQDIVGRYLRPQDLLDLWGEMNDFVSRS